MDIPKHFPPDTGDFISRKEADRLRDNYFKKKHKKHGNEFIQAYFFGKEKLLELLSCQEDIAGLRIYYGDDSDQDGKDDKKMVIYAVDKAGKNILYKKKQNTSEVNSFMATSAKKASDDDDGGALDNGLPCPADCP
ncbi:hypothetical protein [Chitinophaga pinensis]|uniref:Uncharacterized protein n=1 Tax=Chitinophaga pinensis (strain ATCC 43595 / DSM 2588 / LMG 13176 / NBRC 15968 / NCIMB 11800 / UQM 2034) TaxID=485918 RepID=A0A979GS93_CHIPD|nr:hypothetical protein [Chitinophaga pinensis]ACU62902.1 hypothetical protein Cpin_5473 [Chitinophaga pinensis DSM 2588]